MLSEIDNEMQKRGLEAIVVLSFSTYDCSTMRYAAGTHIPRYSAYAKKLDGKPLLVVDPIDLESARRGVVKEIKTPFEFGANTLMGTFLPLLKKLDVEKGAIGLYGEVPSTYALRVSDLLTKAGYGIKLEKTSVFDVARMRKSEDEIGKIRQVGEKVERVYKKLFEFLKKREVTDGKLRYRDEYLTAEDVKRLIKGQLLEYGLSSPRDVTFAVGEKAADPHHRGTAEDIVRVGVPIVIDIFPKSDSTDYWFDTTRTISIGSTTQEIKKAYHDVLSAQQKALDAIREGVLGKYVDDLVSRYFERRGHETFRSSIKKEITPQRGYTSGLGHGVGLSIDEGPFLTQWSTDILQDGNVVTVEPGLCYPNKFGLRIEDMVVVRKNGMENLSRLGKELKI